MTISELVQKIREHKVIEGRLESYDLGEGITLERDGGLVFVADGNDRALVGYHDQISNKWSLYHDWWVALNTTFGDLPSCAVPEPDECDLRVSS